MSFLLNIHKRFKEILNENQEIKYKTECEYLQKVIENHFKLNVSLEFCQAFWLTHSEKYFKDWFSFEPCEAWDIFIIESFDRLIHSIAHE